MLRIIDSCFYHQDLPPPTHILFTVRPETGSGFFDYFDWQGQELRLPIQIVGEPGADPYLRERTALLLPLFSIIGHTHILKQQMIR